MPKTVESLTIENITLRHAVKQYHRKSMLQSAELLPPDQRLLVLMRLYVEDNYWIQCPQTLTGNIKSLLQLFDKLTADNARLRESIQSVLCYAHLPKRYRDELEAAIEKGKQ